MSGNQGKIIQYRIEFPVAPAVKDLREFTCPNDVAHYAVEESGLKQENIAARMKMSKQLLSQKLHGDTANLTCNEYDRLADVLTEMGKKEWSDFMHKYHAARLLPPPTMKEKLLLEMKANDRRNAEIVSELERL